MSDTNRKFELFKLLHQCDGAFVMPNPWDAGSALVLENLGFEALATTSAGLAFSKGYRDSMSNIDRSDILHNATEIVSATSLPVSADLESGFGVLPEDCAETIRKAIEIGLVGGSIEDATGDPEQPLYETALAVDRITAAVEACRDLPFLLTARAENFLYGQNSLDETIARLQAYEEAGADVLYAPGLPDLESIRTVCASVGRPVNVVMGLSGPSWSVTQLAEAGVKRVSVGGSFARAALGGFLRAATEVRQHGTFSYAVEALPNDQAQAFMRSAQ